MTMETEWKHKYSEDTNLLQLSVEKQRSDKESQILVPSTVNC